MNSSQIRQKYLDFFRSKGHAVIPSASLIPENDPTVLFTTAGMHPLVPYLLGEPHPAGRRLTDAQKCIRTGDIDEVGDNRHLTFFEMLGNWSLGDYFKKEAISWSWEFMTGKDWLGLDPNRLYVTVFEGDQDAPADEESIGVWKEQFVQAGIKAELGKRIFKFPKSKNWWGPAGQTGPCGPDTEMFYDTLNLDDQTDHAPGWSGDSPCNPNCDCGRYVEIWNDVFMEYFKEVDGSYRIMENKNVDTGMGLERVAMVMQAKPTVFETDLFMPVIQSVESLSGRAYLQDAETTKAFRVIADHLRAATFILGDQRGVSPSNLDQGYILRRLLRRAVRFGRQIGIEGAFLADVGSLIVDQYGAAYPELVANRQRIIGEMAGEEEKFSRTLEKGLQAAKKFLNVEESPDLLQAAGIRKEPIPGKDAFYLYESYGFPKELTEEITGRQVNQEEWDQAMSRHQEMSRAGSEQKFSSGLADHGTQTVKLHTATHLLHASLRKVLGDHVEQKGSNITPERLRFDFSHHEKMSEEQIKAVEDMVNAQIQADLPVTFRMMSADEAKASGAIGLFDDKYAALGNQIKVYTVGNSDDDYFSKEICSGPHVNRTGEIGKFRIVKENASSSGVRRIKAVVE